uniref:Ribonuclease P protein subunit p30 n=1 Tax=Lygus hesperus TaxID=30085 RepID=A0A0A9X8P2_LYGHE
MLRRITVYINDASQVHLLSSSKSPLTSYDVVAVCVSSEKLLNAVLQSDMVDIITFDMETKLPFYLKPSTVSLALQKHILFEISFNAYTSQSNARIQFLANFQHILFVTRGKQVGLWRWCVCAMRTRTYL